MTSHMTLSAVPLNFNALYIRFFITLKQNYIVVFLKNSGKTLLCCCHTMPDILPTWLNNMNTKVLLQSANIRQNYFYGLNYNRWLDIKKGMLGFSNF